MKYNLNILVDVFKNKLWKVCVIEFSLTIICILLGSDCNVFELILGLNIIDFIDYILIFCRLINICVLLYNTLNIFFYDIYRSPEFIILRKNEKKYFINKIIFIISFLLVYKFIFIVIALIFNFNFDYSVLVNGFFNIIYLSLLGISIINSFSSKQYLFLIIFVVLICFNLFFIIEYIIVKAFICLLLFIYNYYCFNYHNIYNTLY